MIYTKNKLKDGTVVCGPVTAENTYTRCVDCGKEVQIDLRELILAKAQDPYDTEVTCADCTEKMMLIGNINFDAVALLVETFADMGYTVVIRDLFDSFDIEDVHELIPEECELFVDDLLGRIIEVRHEGE